MTKQCKIEIVDHALRWANNILVEILSNYGEYIPTIAQDDLKNAVKHLSNASMNLYKK